MADVINIRTEMKSYGIRVAPESNEQFLRVVPESNEKSLIRDGKDTEKNVTCRWRQTLWSDASVSQGMPRIANHTRS